MITWTDLRREPFRVLFPLGAAFGLLGVGHWLGYASGHGTSSPWFHAALQTGVYMGCFISGFLLTAVPRFASLPATSRTGPAGAPPASTAELLLLLGCLLLQPVFLAFGRWAAAELCFIGMLLAVSLFAGRRFARRRSIGSVPPTEFVWIPIAVLHGIAGAGLLLLGQAGRAPAAWSLAGRILMTQGFLLSIIMGVGGFMAPRLMGTAALRAASLDLSPAQARRIRRRRVAIHFTGGAWLFASCWMEGFGAVRAAYLLRALVVTAELAWTSRFYRAPLVTDTYVRFVWLALWMIPAGLWGASMWPRYRVAMLHLTFIGGLSLMTFAVATMVVLSHGGEAGRLRRPLWVLRLLGVGVLGAMVARVAADVVPSFFFIGVGTASLLWTTASSAWLGWLVPRVVRPSSPETFERLHEDAKRRVMTPG